jgi:hypothetical protein
MFAIHSTQQGNATALGRIGVYCPAQLSMLAFGSAQQNGNEELSVYSKY